MIGTYNYVLFTNDTDFLQRNWAGYQEAMLFILGKVDKSGLLNVTGTRDWARQAQGFHNSEAQMILYKILMTGARLALWIGDAQLNPTWTADAASLRSAVNTQCWDFQYG